MSETTFVAVKKESPLEGLRRRVQPARDSAVRKLGALKVKAGQMQEAAKADKMRTFWILLGIAALVGLVIWGIMEWRKKKEETPVPLTPSTKAAGANLAAVGMVPEGSNCPSNCYAAYGLCYCATEEAGDFVVGDTKQPCPGYYEPGFCGGRPFVNGPPTPKPMPGADCAGLGPQYEAKCKQDKLNKFVAGQCDGLSGCDRQVCEEVFRNGIYPRPLRYASK